LGRDLEERIEILGKNEKQAQSING
jgi:hypothetical protein